MRLGVDDCERTASVEQLAAGAGLLGWDFVGLGAESYLTARLLFGLTLPGVSAHRFLKGAGQNIIHLIYLFSQGETETKRQRDMRERKKETERKREKRETSFFVPV